MTGDARRRSRALSRIANIVGLHSADFLRAPTPESRNCLVHAQVRFVPNGKILTEQKSNGFTNVRFTIAVE
jgi:hypothetical protein